MFCMESKVVDIYSMYNSTINEGRRVRRMRRTQLSASKVEKSLSAKRGSNVKIRSHQKQTSHSYSRSRPKIQPKWNRQNQTKSKASHIKIVQNQYYNNSVNVTEFHRNNNQHSNQRISLTNKRQNQFNKSNNKNGTTNAENSYGQIANMNSQLSRRKLQGHKSDNSRSQNSQKPSVNINIKKTSQISNYRRPASKRSQKSQNSVNKYSSVISNQQYKKQDKISINQYGLKSKVSTIKQQQKQPTVKYSISSKSSFKQSQIRQSSVRPPSKTVSQLSRSKKSQVPMKLLNVQKSKESINNHSQIQVIPNQSSISSSKNSQLIKSLNSNLKPPHKIDNIPKKSAQFFKGGSKISQQFQSGISQNMQSNISSQISKQNFSKIRNDEHNNPIIKSSEPRKQLFKETIESLVNIELKKKVSAGSQKHNQNHSNLRDSRKIQLKIQSSAQDINPSSSIAKFKCLPLASKDLSLRKSIQSFSRLAQPGTLKAFLQNVQIHDLLIDTFYNLQQQIIHFDQEEQNPDNQILAFLLQKKYMYEKSLMIKCLRGVPKNAFITSTAQIQKQQLKKYIQKEQVVTLCFRKQKEMRQKIFKEYQKRYSELKQKHRNNNFIKIESKEDNFSKEIIRRLQQYYNELFRKFTKTNSNLNQQDQLYVLQNRIFNVMEVAFLICELSGKKVKKTQFFQDINDIDQYFQEYQQNLQEVFQYFRNLE